MPATVFAFAAAIRASKLGDIGGALSSATLAFSTIGLSSWLPRGPPRRRIRGIGRRWRMSSTDCQKSAIDTTLL